MKFNQHADPGDYIPFGSLCGSLAAANMDEKYENGRVYSLIVCNIVSLRKNSWGYNLL